jgi:WD40 repeat protein
VTGTAKAVAVSKTGRYVAAGGGYPKGDNTIRVWEAATGREVATMTGHTAAVMRVAFLPDETGLISAGWDGTVRVWRVSDGQELKRVAQTAARFDNVAVFPDGRRCLTVGSDQCVRLWDMDAGRELWKEAASADRGAAALAVSADGRRFATAAFGAAPAVRVWDTETLKVVTSVTTEGEVRSAGFSPNGPWLLTADYEGRIQLWVAETGRPVRTFGTHGQAQSVAFTAGGRLAVSTHGYDSVARVWDVSSGTLVARCVGHKDWVWAAEFTPDGNHVVTAAGGTWQQKEIGPGADHSVRLWRLPDLPAAVPPPGPKP